MQIFSRFAIIADYKINTRDYAEHCENKQKSNLHCNGKCQMIKKLNQEEKKEQQTPERKIEKSFTLYCETFFAHSLSFFTEKRTAWGTYCDKKKIALFSRSLLRPPAENVA